MEGYDKELLELVTEIVAASLEESEIEISAESGKKVAEYFNAILKGISGEDFYNMDESEEEEIDTTEELQLEGDGGEEASARQEPEEEALEENQDETEDENAGKFEIFEDSAGKFRFVLKTAAGEMLVISDGFETAELCQQKVEELRNAAFKAPVEER